MFKGSKGIALGLAFGLGFSLLTGCSGEKNEETNTGTPTASEKASSSNEGEGQKSDLSPVTLKVFHSQQIVTPSEILDNPVMNELEKRTGIKIDWSPYMGAGDAKQKLSALIASNNLPDLIVNSDSDTNKMLLENDLIIPLDELVAQYAPEIVKNIPDAMALSKLMMSNGRDATYFLPGNVNYINFFPNGMDAVFQYRYDLYKKMGSPKLESLDDLLKFGEEAQKLEPKNEDGQKTYTFGIPFADPQGWAYLDWDKSHYDGYWGSKSFFYLDIENDKVVPRLNDPDNSFWKSMEFYNKAYIKGLLDPESATMKFQQVQDKGKALRYHVGLASWQIGWPNSVILGKKDPEKGFVPTLLDSKKDYTFYEFSFPAGNGMYWSVPKDGKNIERVMQLLNFVASYEGSELFWNGLEGEHWDKANGVPVMKERDPNQPVDPDEAKKRGSTYVAPNFILNGGYVNPEGWKTRYTDNSPERWEKDYTEGEKQFMKDYGLKYPVEQYETREHRTANTALIDSIAPEANSELAIKEQSLNAYLDNNIARIVYSKTPEDFAAAKEKFLKELDGMGIQEIVDFYDAKYEEMKQKLKEFKQG